ncbi:MAG: ATP-binding protein [Chitinophagaceae bacterium]
MNRVRKVVIIGPESTGKSTLSAALAKAFDTVWNPEYAREYLEHLDKEYQEEDLLKIAKEQTFREDLLAKTANNFLFCDTDLYVIKVWSEAKYGHCDKAILEEISQRKYDLYLLTDIDIPWQPDPLREHPAPEDRRYFYKQYLDIVQRSGIPWINVRGNEMERLNLGKAAVQALL